MDKAAGGFKGSMFGGFNRKDVVEYIERTAEAHAGAMNGLQAALASAQAALSGAEAARRRAEEAEGALRDELEGAQTENAGLRDELSKLRWRQDELERQIGQAALENENMQLMLDEKKLALDERDSRIGELEQAVESLGAVAAEYDRAKREMAEIEIGAHNRAREIERQADGRAAAARQRMCEMIERFTGQYEQDLGFVADEVDRINGELEQMKQRGADVLAAFVEMGGKLHSLRAVSEQGEAETVSG